MRSWPRDSLVVAFFLASGGVVWAGGNLAFAGLLTTEAFGWLALFQAFLALVGGIAPLGLDSLVVRREVQSFGAALRRAVVTSLVPASAGALVLGLAYGMEPGFCLLLAIGAVGSAVTAVCTAFDRAALRLSRAQLVTQLPYFVFGLVAALSWILDGTEWQIAAFSLVVGHWCAAALAAGFQLSSVAKRSCDGPRAYDSARQLGKPASTALAFAGISLSIALLSQVERLIIPQVLSLNALAAYSVAATMIGAPYRILQTAAGYALMPRIRLAQGAASVHQLIRTELRFLWTVGLVGGGVLLMAVGRLTELLYADKYHIELILAAALVGSGLVKLTYSVASAAMGALGTPTQLRVFNRLGWASVAVSFIFAGLFARLGLAGVVLGASLGWGVRIVNAHVLLRSAITEELGGDSWKHMEPRMDPTPRR